MVSHGTINLVLGNANGIVILTDSRITVGDHWLASPGQKLFRLDDHSVCAIAGFVAAEWPVKDLFLTTNRIVKGYEDKLKSQPPQSIEEKAATLASLFNFRLSALASARDTSPQLRTSPDSYEFQLTVVGYDLDGKPKIATRRLHTTVSQNQLLQSQVVYAKTIEVEQELVFHVAGQPETAEGILENPSQALDDPTIDAFSKAMKKDQGKSLSLEALKKLAANLAMRTATVNRTVGGPNQIATLQDGHIVNMEQPQFQEDPQGVDDNFNIATGSYLSHMGRYGLRLPGLTAVLIRNHIKASGQLIDGHFFFGNTFEDCQILFDGKVTSFDKSNIVTNSELVIGPHANRDSEFVKNLVKDFAWTKITYSQ